MKDNSSNWSPKRLSEGEGVSVDRGGELRKVQSSSFIDFKRHFRTERPGHN